MGPPGFMVGFLPSDLDLNLYSGRELQLHQGIDGLCVGIVDVDEADIGVEFELLAALLVYEGGAVHSEDLLVGGKRNGTYNLCTRCLHCIYDLDCGLVHKHVIEGFKLDSDFLAHITNTIFTLLHVLLFVEGHKAVSALFDDILCLCGGNL